MTARPGILLDWDGTVLGSFPALVRATRRVFAEHGVTWCDRRFQEHHADWRAHYRAAGIPEEALTAASQAYRDAYRLERPRLRAHARATLEMLSGAGVSLALVTAGTGDRVREEVQRSGLASLFSTVVAAEDVVHRKPNPEPLLLAVRRLDLRVSKVIAVGDTESDRRAALAAGIRHFTIRSPFTDPAACADALPTWEALGRTLVCELQLLGRWT